MIIASIGLLEYVERVMLEGFAETLQLIISTGDFSSSTFAETSEKIFNVQVAVYSIVISFTLLIALVSVRLAINPVRQSLMLQRRFLASVAHELRTPLAILKTQNEVALFEVDTNSATAETLRQNVQEVDHMAEILNNLLLFNRVDTLESILFEMTDIAVILETVTSRMKKRGDDKNINVIFKESDIPKVYGNATALEQAFFNLLKNAVAYTDNGGTVSIHCVEVTESHVTVRVTDSGIGIKSTELQHIFEPFYRTDTAQEVSKGTGLGLALVYEIIKLHNGKIHVESTPDVGSQFTVTLPRQQPGLLSSTQQTHDSVVAFDFSIKKDTSSAPVSH